MLWLPVWGLGSAGGFHGGGGEMFLLELEMLRLHLGLPGSMLAFGDCPKLTPFFWNSGGLFN